MKSTNILWAGIEIGKDKCDIEVIDNGENTVNVFNFENRNTENGFKKVKKIADMLSKKYKATVVFGHEPTSEYHANIREYLIKNGYDVIKLEAKHSKKFRALFNDRAKTDKIDKNILARELKFFYEKDIQKTIEDMSKNNIERNELKDLTRFRAYIVKERSKFKNKLKIHSFLLFPEIGDVFSNFFGKGAMFINKKYMTPDDILKAGEEQLAKELAENSNNVFGKKKAKELIQAANNASGLSSRTGGLKITKGITIDIIKRFDKYIRFLDKEIKKMLADDEVAKVILSYPGAGMVLASTFIAETKGLNFKSERDFMSFCGLCSNTNQSSKLEKDGRITEGDKHIRMAFFQAANPCIRDKKGNQTIRDYYKKKLSEYEKTKYGKKKAKIASAAKLAGIIFAMVKKMEKYDPDYESKMKAKVKQK